MADVDGDGQLDLLTGSDNCCDHEPGFYWFRRRADGRFAAPAKVRVKVADGAPRFMPRFRVALADWDGDSRLDVVAALSGTRPGLYLSRGAWTADTEVDATRPVAGSPDEVGTQPCVIDWDGDGRLDLVDVADRRTGDGTAVISEVVWHRNLGGAGPPRLSGPHRLASLPALETATGLSAGDWDGDGWPDLIVGYVRGSIEGGSYRYVAAGIRVYPRRRGRLPGQPR